MGRDAATPGEDFKISAAGPLATLAVILVCLAVDVAIVGIHRLTHAILLDSDIQITPVLLSLSWLVPMNVLLLVFNLVPALPARRRPDRPLDRLADHRREAPRHRDRGAARSGFRDPRRRRRTLDAGLAAQLHRPVAGRAGLHPLPVGPRSARAVGSQRADRRGPRAGHHGHPPGSDPVADAGQPGPRGVLLALPLVVVSRRRRGRTPGGDRPPGARPGIGRRRRGLADDGIRCWSPTPPAGACRRTVRSPRCSAQSRWGSSAP